MEVIAYSASVCFTLEGVPEFVSPKRDHEFLLPSTPASWEYTQHLVRANI